MQFDDVAAAGARVQAIDILGDEQKLRRARFQLDQRPVSRVRLRLRDQFTPPCVPLPHQLRVVCEGFGRGELFRAEARPETGHCVAEGGYAGFGGDAGTGEHDDTLRAAQSVDQRFG